MLFAHIAGIPVEETGYLWVPLLGAVIGTVRLAWFRMQRARQRAFTNRHG